MKNENIDIIMLTSPECPHCASAKELLADSIKNGQVKILDVSNSEIGSSLANKYNIKGVPSMIVTNKTTQISEVCQLSSDGKKLFCPNNKQLDI